MISISHWGFIPCDIFQGQYVRQCGHNRATSHVIWMGDFW
jgi:hypothetical protein